MQSKNRMSKRLCISRPLKSMAIRQILWQNPILYVVLAIALVSHDSSLSQVNPISPPGIASLAIENQLRYLGQQSGIPYVILRGFPSFWPSASQSMSLGGSDQIHVGDVARGLILAAQQSAVDNLVVNLGSGRVGPRSMTLTTSVSSTCFYPDCRVRELMDSYTWIGRCPLTHCKHVSNEDTPWPRTQVWTRNDLCRICQARTRRASCK
jgi:hypothetical protein